MKRLPLTKSRFNTSYKITVSYDLVFGTKTTLFANPVFAWLRDNASDHWDWNNDPDSRDVEFIFQNRADALAFKLHWRGKYHRE